jgi:hypothetical protein
VSKRRALNLLAMSLATLHAANAFGAEPEPPRTEAPTSTEAEPGFALAVAAESAFGLSGAGFYNQLAGLRLDYRTASPLTLGVGTSYANLKASDGGRTHNALITGMLEWNAPLSRQAGLPLRLVSGYLPKNGPFIKTAIGLSYEFSAGTRLTLELLAPALWIVRDSTVGSFDATIELAFAL